MKTTGLIGLLLLSGLAGACSPANNTGTGMASPSPLASVSPTPASGVIGAPNATASPLMSPMGSPTGSPGTSPTPRRTAINTRTVQNPDGSTTVVTTWDDGTKSEERTFTSGRLARVTRNTDTAGRRTARVTYRENNREVELREASWVDKSMDATGDALATAADKVKQGAVEVADKTEDAYDATKKGVKKGVNEVGDKAEDVGDAVKKGVKKATGKSSD